jgi:predicted Zn-dependent peptidase
MLKKTVFTFILLYFFFGSAHLAQQKAAPKVNPTPEEKSAVYPLPKGVSIYQLDNGMEVLLIENPALPMVGVNVVVKVGSAYETFATSGMSHMLEHLLFNGTTTRTQKELYDQTDQIGGYNNAHTADFYTNYMMVTPAEHIRKGMELQTDMLFNSVLPEDKFEKEKGIVLEEIARSLANSGEQMERNIISVLYQEHALSLPTLGTYSTIRNMNRDDVYNFYKNNYLPNNMILNAVGNFQTDTMLAAIKEIYGKTAPGIVQQEDNPSRATGFRHPSNPMPQQNRVFHRFYSGDETQLQMFFPIPRFPQTEAPELIDLKLEKQVDSLQTTLTGEFPGQVNSLKMSTRSSVLGNYLQMTAVVADHADLQKISEALLRHAAGLNFALPKETVEAQAVKARTDFLKNIEKPHMFGIYNASILAEDGIEAVLTSYRGEGYYAAAKHLRELKLAAPPVVIVQHPEPKSSGGTVSAAQNRHLFTHDNSGLAVIAMQNEASNLLAIHYLVKHKAMLESQYGKDAAKILHDCLGQRLKSDQNKKASSRFGFTYTVNDNPFIPMDNIYLHPDFGYIRAEGLADDVAGAIAFLNKQLEGFIPTEEEFQKAQAGFGRVDMMGMGGQKASKLFDNTLDEILYEATQYPEGPELTYENLVAIAKEYFLPDNMIISTVSPLSPDSLNRLFAGFGANIAKPEFVSTPAYNRSFKMPTEPVSVEKEGGGEQSYLFWGFIKKIEKADKPALKALSLVLADRIIFDIREKQGMAYRMSAGIDMKKDAAQFYIRMGTRPQNVDKLIPQYPGFFDPKLLESLGAEELQKSVNMYLGRMMFRRLSSINQAYYLGHSYYFYDDINYDENFLNDLKTVTVGDVQRVANQYMKAENSVQVVVR